MASVAQRVPGRRWTTGVLLGISVLINGIDRINILVAAPQLQQEFGLTRRTSAGHSARSSGPTRCSKCAAEWFSTGSASGTWGSGVAFLWAVASAAIVSGFTSIFGMRVLLGVAEAATFPASQKVTGY